MIRNKFLLKSITTFLLLEMLFNIVTPTVSWALTSGASMPEFSSFEPVDTTDMVNIATGEFVYNMPLLEVPGPSGGYPLSLSYHAGIKPEYEASWVGIGFTLNPGAINRTVNGFADDNYNVRREVRDYWAGGESLTKSYALGVSIPNTGIGVNWTHTVTRDTYKGFSTNNYYGISVDPVALGMNVAGGTFGGMSKATRQDRASQKDWSGTYGFRSGANFSSLTGLLAPRASVDFSISSSGIKTTATIAGHTFGQRNNFAGSTFLKSKTTDRGQFQFWIFSVGLRDFYTRYWSDQADALYTYGPLYYSKNTNQDHYEYYNGVPDDGEPDYGESEFRSYANDVYEIPDKPYQFPQITYDAWDQADPSRQVGGSLPAYDQYFVTGQGISGAIEPTIYENGVLKGQNAYFRNPAANGGPVPSLPTIKYNSLRDFSSTKKVSYRFKNDFSNALTMSGGAFSGAAGNNLTLSNNSVSASDAGYVDNANEQRLAGSKHVEWFSNAEIYNGVAKAKGFIDCYTTPTQRNLQMQVYEDYLQPEASVPVYQKNFRGKANGIITTDTYPANIQATYTQPYRFNSLKPRTVSLAEKVGGFMITNESGVTYHYGLPVYSYNEYTRLKLKKPMKGAATITETRNTEPYAYTWLLTAITGPDYVDRSADGTANGILDEYDFGYWVKFDYGKWTDSYQWRTPHTGYTSDFESEYETFSYGIKELYYLDAIETKTHKAIFIKSKRKDGRGVTSRLEGGSNPRKYTMHYRFDEENLENSSSVSGFTERGHITYSVSPVSTLKLDAIYLFDKKDLEGVSLAKATGDKYDQGSISNPHKYYYDGEAYRYQFPFPVNGKVITIRPNEDFIPVKYHNGDLVYDDEDLAIWESQTNGVKQKALKAIEFETDYSLSQGVPNSFDSFDNITGKTCANGLTNFGYTCAQQGTNFDFEWPSFVDASCYPQELGSAPLCCNYNNPDGTKSPYQYSNDRSAFYSYDPLAGMRLSNCTSDFMGNNKNITYQQTGKLTLKKVKVLGHGATSVMPPTTFAYNKNPAYSADKYDDWGFYKSDYKPVEDLEGTTESFTNGGVTTTYQTAQLYTGTRRITSASAQDVDAWSLSSIGLPLGSTINITYEPNKVNRSVLNNGLIFSIDKLVQNGNAYVDVYFKEKGLNLSSYFSVGSAVNIQSLIISQYSGGGLDPFGETYISSSDLITSIGDKYIRIASSSLNNLLEAGRKAIISGSSKTVTPYFIAGSIYIPQDEVTDKYVGGIRVKSIAVNEFRGHVSATDYIYNKPETSISSGVTSFQPFNAIAINFPTDIEFFKNILSEEPWEDASISLRNYKTEFLHRMNRLYANVLLYAREAPAPGALYEYVTVHERYDENALPQQTRYQFKPFDQTMVSIERNEDASDPYLRQFNIYNTAVDVGNLLKKQTVLEDGTVLHETSYGYLYDETDESFEVTLKAKKQGIMEQAFHKYISLKEYWYNNEPPAGVVTFPLYEESKAILTKRIDRSNVMTSVRETNFKTGQSSSTKYLDFDFYSGKAFNVETQESSGAKYQTVMQFAYTVPEYSGMEADQISAQMKGMGLKIKNPANKHMLTQEAASYTYKSDYNPSGLVSVSAQSWSDELATIDYFDPLADTSTQAGIWRKNARFSFIGNESVPLRVDGMYPGGSYTDFLAWKRNDPVSEGWQLDGKTTLYDWHSNPLETRDINGLYASSMMTGDGTRVAAEASPARYWEFSYAGAEDKPNGSKFSNLISIGAGAARSAAKAHTGSYSVSTTSVGYIFESQLLSNKPYLVSVWSSTPQMQLKYSINGGTTQDFTPSTYVQVGDWYLFTGTVTPTDKNVKIWCQANGAGIVYFDDFRVHPYQASMNSYVYNKFGELSYMLDDHNFYTHFEYDAAGRLIATTRETQSGVKQVNSSTYKYQGQN